MLITACSSAFKYHRQRYTLCVAVNLSLKTYMTIYKHKLQNTRISKYTLHN